MVKRVGAGRISNNLAKESSCCYGTLCSSKLVKIKPFYYNLTKILRGQRIKLYSKRCFRITGLFPFSSSFFFQPFSGGPLIVSIDSIVYFETRRFQTLHLRYAHTTTNALA